MPSGIRELLRQRRPLLIGHRGAAALAPENTLAAFQAGLAAGVDLVELDYHHSADGVPVVIHDKTLDRTTNAVGLWGRTGVAVAQTTLKQLNQLDAGGWFAQQFVGQRVVRLADALGAICPTSLAAIEHKAGDAATCVGLLEELDVIDWVVVMSFDWAFLKAAHALCPTLVAVALGDKRFDPRVLEDVAAVGASIVGWNQQYLGQRDIERIHASGRPAWVYTVNDPRRTRALLLLGIDGIISDDPASQRSAFSP